MVPECTPDVEVEPPAVEPSADEPPEPPRGDDEAAVL